MRPMRPSRQPLPVLETSLQGILFGLSAFLTFLYVVEFRNPPFPAVVPVALWFFFLLHTMLLRVLRLGRRSGDFWQYALTLALAAIGTVGVYLAGQVDEQDRPFHQLNRSIDE